MRTMYIYIVRLEFLKTAGVLAVFCSLEYGSPWTHSLRSKILSENGRRTSELRFLVQHYDWSGDDAALRSRRVLSYTVDTPSRKDNGDYPLVSSSPHHLPKKPRLA